MNHQGQRWNVHYVANVGLRKRLNLCKRGFKIYDLLVASCPRDLSRGHEVYIVLSAFLCKGSSHS